MTLLLTKNYDKEKLILEQCLIKKFEIKELGKLKIFYEKLPSQNWGIYSTVKIYSWPVEGYWQISMQTN